MLLEYVAIAIFIVLTTLVAIIAITLGTIFGPRHPAGKKSMPYESGMNPIGPGTRRIPVRFYLIAVLFILFDIEVVFFTISLKRARGFLCWAKCWCLSQSYW
jgi:NADH-quinone oxidoreductase subunit A